MVNAVAFKILERVKVISECAPVLNRNLDKRFFTAENPAFSVGRDTLTSCKRFNADNLVK